MIKISVQENQRMWESRIAEQVASGLTQKEWCDANDINLHNLRYWKHRLVVSKQQASITQRFVAISPIQSQAFTQAPLRLSIGKLAVEIREGIDIYIKILEIVL